MINRKALIREIKAFILSRLLLFSGGVKTVDRHLQDGVQGEVEKKRSPLPFLEGQIGWKKKRTEGESDEGVKGEKSSDKTEKPKGRRF